MIGAIRRDEGTDRRVRLPSCRSLDYRLNVEIFMTIGYFCLLRVCLVLTLRNLASWLFRPQVAITPQLVAQLGVLVAGRYFWIVAILHLTQRMYLSFWARLVEADVMAEWM
jgi:hypothetical protein